MSGFLLDTNVLSETVKPRPEPKVVSWIYSTNSTVLYLSVLTLGELRKGVAQMPDGARRNRLEMWLSVDLADWFGDRLLSVDAAIADRWGRLTAAAKRSGVTLQNVDGLLAATALHYNLILVTRNIRDMSLPGVAIFNPWES